MFKSQSPITYIYSKNVLEDINNYSPPITTDLGDILIKNIKINNNYKYYSLIDGNCCLYFEFINIDKDFNIHTIKENIVNYLYFVSPMLKSNLSDKEFSIHEASCPVPCLFGTCMPQDFYLILFNKNDNKKYRLIFYEIFTERQNIEKFVTYFIKEFPEYKKYINMEIYNKNYMLSLPINILDDKNIDENTFVPMELRIPYKCGLRTIIDNNILSQLYEEIILYGSVRYIDKNAVRASFGMTLTNLYKRYPCRDNIYIIE